MNMYARFDEIPSNTLKDIKETKCNGRTDGRTDNVKTVYPPTNTVCGVYKDADQHVHINIQSLINAFLFAALVLLKYTPQNNLRTTQCKFP